MSMRGNYGSHKQNLITFIRVAIYRNDYDAVRKYMEQGAKKYKTGFTQKDLKKYEEQVKQTIA